MSKTITKETATKIVAYLTRLQSTFANENIKMQAMVEKGELSKDTFDAVKTVNGSRWAEIDEILSELRK